MQSIADAGFKDLEDALDGSVFVRRVPGEGQDDSDAALGEGGRGEGDSVALGRSEVVADDFQGWVERRPGSEGFKALQTFAQRRVEAAVAGENLSEFVQRGAVVQQGNEAAGGVAVGGHRGLLGEDGREAVRRKPFEKKD